jgi:predicted transcriptional regulator
MKSKETVLFHLKDRSMTCAQIVNNILELTEKNFPDFDKQLTRKRLNSSLSSTLKKLTTKGILKREIGGPRGGSIYTKA